MRFKRFFNEVLYVNRQKFNAPIDVLRHYLNNHSNPVNLVVTYTSVDKVGINPRSQWDTPIGIYFYPLYYVVKENMQVPFASELQYINVCELTNPSKILHMESVISNSSWEAKLALQKGLDLLKKISQNTFYKTGYHSIINDVKEKFNIRSNYSYLWLGLRLLANKNPKKWNSLFRQIDIKGC